MRFLRHEINSHLLLASSISVRINYRTFQPQSKLVTIYDIHHPKGAGDFVMKRESKKFEEMKVSAEIDDRYLLPILFTDTC
jgi:hypothetical protein